MAKYKATGILWDLDPEDIEAGVVLPVEMSIPEEITDDCKDYEDLVETVSDYLTDMTSFCHGGFELDVE